MLANTDPTVHVTAEDSGDLYISTINEAQIYVSIKDLGTLTTCQFTASDPRAIYREIVTEKSSTCVSKSSDKQVSISMTAEPIGQYLIDDIEAGVLSGETSTVANKLVEAYDWQTSDASNVWAFGTNKSANMLVNMTTGSVEQLNECKELIIKAFQSISKEGALCGEPMRGVRFNLVNGLTLTADSVAIESAMRRAMYASTLSATPCLQEPFYLLDILTQSGSDGALTCIQKRGGIVSSTHSTTPSLSTMVADIPVSKSFDIVSYIRSTTAGECSIQIAPSRWDTINNDPLDNSSTSSTIVKDIRTHK
eukprot:gene11412-13301_t